MSVLTKLFLLSIDECLLMSSLPDKALGMLVNIEKLAERFNMRSKKAEPGKLDIKRTGGEFNNARVCGRSLLWYLSLFVMLKAWHQYNEHP